MYAMASVRNVFISRERGQTPQMLIAVAFELKIRKVFPDKVRV